MAALFGTATVLLIMNLARQLTGSSVIAAFAGILALFDGVLLITSRFGMLDIFQTLFIVGAAYCLARDYNQMRVRLHLTTSRALLSWLIADLRSRLVRLPAASRRRASVAFSTRCHSALPITEASLTGT